MVIVEHGAEVSLPRFDGQHLIMPRFTGMAREELWPGFGALFRTLAGWPSRARCGVGGGCRSPRCTRRSRWRARPAFSSATAPAARAPAQALTRPSPASARPTNNRRRQAGPRTGRRRAQDRCTPTLPATANRTRPPQPASASHRQPRRTASQPEPGPHYTNWSRPIL
jgi:hypothetical protein